MVAEPASDDAHAVLSEAGAVEVGLNGVQAGAELRVAIGLTPVRIRVADVVLQATGVH